MNRHGQSMIEYMFIAVLIILGIVIMGPYVLRSINAHFKLWDESVQDSSTENITQAPVNTIPIIPPNCNCTDSAPQCQTQPCPPNQGYVLHSCNPVGCDDGAAYSCIPDISCCSGWLDAGCGTLPVGSPQPTNNNCDYGYDIQVNECGNTNTYQCVYDPQPKGPCPLPTCLGIVSPGALYCATNSTLAPANLTQSYGITYVSTCPCPSPPCANATCQVFCGPGYFLNSTGTACLNLFTVAASLSSCSGVPTGCTSFGGPVVTTINDQSFPMCAGAGGTITAVSVVADPTGQTVTTPVIIPQPGGTAQDGCQNPSALGDEGEPSDTCQVTFTY